MNKPFPVFCCSFKVGTDPDDDEEDWLDCAARTIGKVCPNVRSNTQANLGNKLITAPPVFNKDDWVPASIATEFYASFLRRVNEVITR